MCHTSSVASPTNRGNSYKSNFINSYGKSSNISEGHPRTGQNALEIRDRYREKILSDGETIVEVGSTGQMTTKQHPLCGLLYQQEMLCLSYAKALGGTAAKAAAKPEDKGDKDATNALNEFIDGMR